MNQLLRLAASFFLMLAAHFIFTANVFSQSSLPKCKGDSSTWDNCYGREITGSLDFFAYQGEWRKGMPDGKGEFIGLNRYYQGEVRDGLPNGRGKYFAKPREGSSAEMYEGEWLDGERSGRGIKRALSGYQNPPDQCGSSPDCIRSEKDLDEFIKEFNDKKNTNPRQEYAGEWSHGLPNGRGTLIDSGFKYVGEFRDGKKEGQGTETAPDGIVYFGTFKNDLRQGKATVTFPDGRRWEGYLEANGDGKGILIRPNGRKLHEGEFLKGDINGQGTHFWRNGNQTTGDWKAGKFLGSISNGPIGPPVTSGRAKINSSNGDRVVSVGINRKVSLDFVVDSSAESTSLPVDYVSDLIDIGVIPPFNADVTAIGKKEQSFTVDVLTIGGMTFKNIKIVLTDDISKPTLGRAFPGPNASWRIDEPRKELVIGGSRKSLNRAGTSNPARGPSTAKVAPRGPAKTISKSAVAGAKHRVGETFKNSIGMDLVWIPAGSFIMGSSASEAQRDDDEGPQRRVTFAEGFWIGKYEVTQGQWQSVMGSNPSNFSNCGSDCPVEQVSWNDANEFIAKLNAKNDGFIYSLPTEAQWEYAARAGTTTAFALGESLSSNQANFNGNYPYGSAPKGPHLQTTTKVGSYVPNAWGLHDMHGNVWDWVEDWYTEGYSGLPTDGSANLTMGKKGCRVLRGGSWGAYGYASRSANRFCFSPTVRLDNIGFRVAARPK